MQMKAAQAEIKAAQAAAATDPPTSRPTNPPTTNPTKLPLTGNPTFDLITVMASASSTTKSTLGGKIDDQSDNMVKDQSLPTNPPIKEYESSAIASFSYNQSPETSEGSVPPSQLQSTGDDTTDKGWYWDIGSNQYTATSNEDDTRNDASYDPYQSEGWDLDSFTRNSRNSATVSWTCACACSWIIHAVLMHAVL